MERQADHTLNRAGAAVAIMLILLLGLAIGILAWVPIPDKNQTTMSMLIGGLISMMSAVGQFFFGSTSSSKTQTATNNTLANAVQTALNTPTADQLKKPPNVTQQAWDALTDEQKLAELKKAGLVS